MGLDINNNYYVETTMTFKGNHVCPGAKRGLMLFLLLFHSLIFFSSFLLLLGLCIQVRKNKQNYEKAYCILSWQI